MRHFMQLPNKTVSLLDQELALKNGEMTFEFGGTEKVLVTESALQQAIAGMSAPITVATKADLDALTDDQVDVHKRVFVEDDGDGKWAYYMITDISGDKPAYIKVSDEDIFGALFSDDVTAQVSKIGALGDLEPGMQNPATIIEALNFVYNQGVALNTRVGDNADLTTTQKGTIVAAMNELVVNISSNDGDILTIQNNIGDLTTINLTDAADKATVVAAINKVLAVQATKLDAEDVVPIIVSYTGLLTDLSTQNQNSLVEAINEVVKNLKDQSDAQIAITGDLANLVTTDKSNLVAAINEVQGNVVSETTRATNAEATLTSNLSAEVTRATNAENTLQTNLDTEASTRAAKDGDLTTLTTDVKSNLVAAINEVDANSDAEAARATAAENTLTTAVNTEISDRTNADTAIQTELDNTQVGAGLETNGDYTADAATNYIATATSLKNADKLLDTQAKAQADNLAAEITRATTAENTNATNLTQEVTDRTNADSAIQAELDATQTGAGLAESGAYTANTDANYISNAVTLADADNKLDAQVKVNTDAIAAEEAARIAADTTLQGNIDTTNTNLTQEVSDRTNADTALDTRITNVEDQVNGNIGDLTTLTTDAKDTLVKSINEVDAHADTNAANLAQEINDRTAAVSTEETARTNADNTLTSNLNDEVTRAKNAEATLTDNLATETARATTAENTNATAIADETTRATTAEGNLTFDPSLNTETTDEDGNTVVTTPADLTDAINKETNRATTSEAALAKSISDLEAAGNATTDDLQSQITAEISRATDAESNLDSKIDTSVSNLVNGAPELLDTLKELADAIGDDENFATTVANNIADAKSELKGTASEAMDTMGEIEGKINDTIAAQAAKDSAQDDALNQEITDRTNADTTLTNNLAQEVTDRTNADTAIQAELDATQTGAGLGTDGTYTADANTNYLTNATSLADADKKLDAQAKVQADNLAAEIARATAAETDNTNAINDEATTARAAEKANADAIANETTRATNAENTLDTRITNVEDQVNGNIGDLSTLTTDDKSTLVKAINEVDAHADTNAANLATEIANRQSAVSAEETARTTSDSAIQAELDATQTGAGLETDGTYTAIGAYDATNNVNGGYYIGTAANLKDADKKLDTQAKIQADNLTTEIANRTAADTALSNDLAQEVSDRTAADNVISDNLTAETARATNAENTNAAAITAETTRAKTAEGNLGFNSALQVDDGDNGTRLAANLTEAVNAEVARASASENTLTNNLAAEVTRATGAENTLQTNIGNEEAARTAADNTLQSNLDDETTRATNAEKANADAITNEQDRATAAEKTLTDNLTAEANTRSTNDGTLVFNSPLADATNLTDAVNAELARATNAETSLQTNIDNEVTRATNAETTLTNNLADEISRATAAEKANADAISALDDSTNASVGDLANLTTDDKTNVVNAINEVESETDINTLGVASIKAFINSMISKSGKTLENVSLVANTAYEIDISDLASTNVAVTIYSIDGTVLSQEYGMFVDVDTEAKTLKIISAIDENANIVIVSDISGLSIA